MVRFRNPASNINNYFHVFRILYSELKEKEPFNLDNITKALIDKNMVSSSGYTGQKALKRSTKKNRSLDQLYNQSKSYSEIFRLLGWIQSIDTAHEFVFTYLGAHVANSNIDPLPLFKESLIGINYPTNVITTKTNIGEERPFATILKTAYDLNNYIYKKELIIGPLNVDYRNNQEYTEKINEIKNCRGNYNKLKSKIKKLCEKDDISPVTWDNSTRFPMSALQASNFFEKVNKKVDYGSRHTVALKLTDDGHEFIEFINEATDIRLNDFNSYNKKEKEAIIRISFFQMLERANFDISEINHLINEDFKIIKNKYPSNTVFLFSPYQTLDKQIVDNALSDYIKISDNNRIFNKSIPDEYYNFTEKRQFQNDLIISEKLSSEKRPVINKISNKIEDYGREMDIDKIVSKIFNEYKDSNQKTFYPLVKDLFTIIDFKCELPRKGVNYERWDAIIKHPEKSIPIEIKSPGEEIFISVKAIRQALENKIILLSRKTYKTEYDIPSLVVGYKLPNKRSEVENLLIDIESTYNIKIAIFGLKSLLELAVKKVLLNKNINKSDFYNLGGLINVKDF